MAERRRPVVLVVRDGWGRNPHPEHEAHNAILQANTPCADRLLRNYPWTLIHTSGEDVGVPEGTMGNSEVGHQNLGAGRIVDQDSVRITKSIRDGSFFENPTLVEPIRRSRDAGRRVHLMGIASDAGVHGLLEHLEALLELARRLEHPDVCVHLFTDGRDTGPFTGQDFIGQVEARCQALGVGRVVSVIGRYWAMDRDHRWHRTERAWACLTGNFAREHDVAWSPTGEEAARRYYKHPAGENMQGDEFITPTMVGHEMDDDPRKTRVEDGDTVIFYNYRGDRPRQLIRAFTLDEEAWQNVRPSPESGQHGFNRGERPRDLEIVTLTRYEEGLDVSVAFPKQPPLESILGETLAREGLRQFRCAETEKFAHVTFFFNDYREAPFEGESREMAQSPQVATYELAPEMSAAKVTDLVIGRIAGGETDFILVNYANGDMVGHTGDLEAAVRAAEAVDAGVERLVEATLEAGGALIVTADHGNAEQMFDPETGERHTAHTTYDVECILVDERVRDRASGNPVDASPRLRSGGRLADIAPTLLDMMDLEVPAAMTGRSLLDVP